MVEFAFLQSNLIKAIPFARELGVTLSEIGPGTSLVSLTPEPSHANPTGTLHAAVIFTLAETACGAALVGGLSELALNILPVVRNADISYDKSVRLEGPVTAAGTLVSSAEALIKELRAGNRVDCVVEARLLQRDDVTLARMTSTWTVRVRNL